jgi:hypothetical protein
LLVVATKALHVYDTLGKTFEQVDWFTLRRPFDLGDRVEERLVDIVTEAGVPAFIDACRSTMAGIKQRIESRSSEIESAAAAQYEKYKQASLDAALHAVAADRR